MDRKRVKALEDKAIDLGRKLGRIGEMWFPFKTIFEHAMDRQTMSEDIAYTDEEEQLYAAFLTISEQVPSIMDIITALSDADFDFYCKKLDVGRCRARNEDTSTFTSKGAWYDGQIPTDTRKAGFKNEFCAGQLCPVTVDWSDEQARKPLVDGTLFPSPGDSPKLLYADERYNPEDFMDGYLKNIYLVLGARAIMLGPSAAHGRMTGMSKKSGNAAKHGIKTVNFAFIAYVACLHHFMCSSQETFCAGGENSGWPYAAFYRGILEVVDCMSEEMKGGLLKWWNLQVFGGICHGRVAGTVEGQPSQMERMKAQLKATRGARRETTALHNSTNEPSGSGSRTPSSGSTTPPPSA